MISQRSSISRASMSAMRFSRIPALGCAVVAAAVFAAGCGSKDSSSSGPTTTLSAAAQKGSTIAHSMCLSCHSTDGKRSAGPTLQNLYGSDVALSDGRTVKADDAYLKLAIQDPDAEQVSGYAKIMGNRITKGMVNDEDTAALIEYIKSLHKG